MTDKLMIRVSTEELTYSYDTVPIDKLLEVVQRNKNAGATTVDIESPSDDSDVQIDFYYVRKETDEEYEARLIKVRLSQESSRIYKMREYERLKKELGL